MKTGWAEYEFVAKVDMGNPKIYVGDICYALDKDIYDKDWGGNSYEDGEIKHDGKTVALVVGTAYGDGCYHAHNGHEFDVDAGVIGIVPAQYWKKDFDDKDPEGYDIVDVTGYDQVTCRLTYDNGEIGVFIKDKENKMIYNNSIYTADFEDEEEEEWEEENYWDDEEEELEESMRRVHESVNKSGNQEYDWSNSTKIDMGDGYNWVDFSVVAIKQGANVEFDLGTLSVDRYSIDPDQDLSEAQARVREYLKTPEAVDDFFADLEETGSMETFSLNGAEFHFDPHNKHHRHLKKTYGL